MFRPETAGDDLILALLKMMNQIKTQRKIPSIFQYANITMIWKGKGSKKDMVNQRGIFGVVTLHYILDKLIYNAEYENIDKNMSDSNVGARKDRNIRDNMFVLNGIINSAVNKETGPLYTTLLSALTRYG